AGAVGLMQILPQTAEFLAHRSGATTFTVSDLSTPAVNIAYGSYYLRYLLDRYGGSEMLALAAYNGGEANVDRWLADARARSLTISEIRFPETRAYVERVLSAQRDYRRKYATELGYR
ncbi:MAG TPA: lytic transglycosylase domain-containing protein, partial [Gaiellales bacterium]|nr:lytic transglycosylase domain-containing protein [Gaiellales bacterium]